MAGDTSSARADYGATMNEACYKAAFDYNAPGHDVVYQYTPDTDDPFLVSVVPLGEAETTSPFPVPGTSSSAGRFHPPARPLAALPLREERDTFAVRLPAWISGDGVASLKPSFTTTRSVRIRT